MKKICKTIISWLFILAALPFYLLYRWLFLGSDHCFTSISEFLSLFPGYPGYFIRQGFYRLTLKTGENFHTCFGTILQYPSICIGANVYIGQHCNIAKATIGSHVKIGSGVHIINKDTHAIAGSGEVLATDIAGLVRVHIGDHTWIGNSALILADVGNRCTVGAGTVVTRPIPDDSVAVGNPARIVRQRLNKDGDHGD